MQIEVKFIDKENGNILLSWKEDLRDKEVVERKKKEILEIEKTVDMSEVKLRKKG